MHTFKPAQLCAWIMFDTVQWWSHVLTGVRVNSEIYLSTYIHRQIQFAAEKICPTDVWMHVRHTSVHSIKFETTWQGIHTITWSTTIRYRCILQSRIHHGCAHSICAHTNSHFPTHHTHFLKLSPKLKKLKNTSKGGSLSWPTLQQTAACELRDTLSDSLPGISVSHSQSTVP